MDDDCEIGLQIYFKNHVFCGYGLCGRIFFSFFSFPLHTCLTDKSFLVSEKEKTTTCPGETSVDVEWLHCSTTCAGDFSRC